MAKVISEAAATESAKMVKIQHTRVMKNANGNDVTVLDYEETKKVDEAISEAETRKASLEAQVVEVDAELVDLKAIKDA
tara:strand:- start:751 stop:987 length:237 start_codon:yes stop_codon:yes gene_type:complete